MESNGFLLVFGSKDELKLMKDIEKYLLNGGDKQLILRTIENVNYPVLCGTKED